MISIDEIIKEVSSLKASSEQLSIMFSAAGQNLQKSTNVIATIVKGSRTGQDAVYSLNIAARSLSDAAVSVKTLGRTCDDCIAHLSK